jgi:hypothetical protein
VFFAAGKLVFVRQGTLLEQAFDVDRLELTGSPTPLAEEAGVDANGHAALGVSNAGVVAFRTAAATTRRQFVWYDRSGKVVGRVGEPDDHRGWSPRLSPDESTVAVHRSVDGNVDIWLLDVRRGVFSRLTTDPATQLQPVWSPDGLRLAYSSFRPGGFEVQARTLATGAELTLGTRGNPADWSPDGRILLVNSGNDVTALRLEDRTSQTVVAKARRGQFSPDGTWLVYESVESGQSEVYVQAFPQATGKIRVSTNGGAQARWSPSGRELFYIALDERLMTVSIRPGVGGVVEPQAPVPLFATNVGGAVEELSSALYMVSADGQRFLISTLLPDVNATPITLILNRRSSP